MTVRLLHTTERGYDRYLLHISGIPIHTGDKRILLMFLNGMEYLFTIARPAKRFPAELMVPLKQWESDNLRHALEKEENPLLVVKTSHIGDGLNSGTDLESLSEIVITQFREAFGLSQDL